MPAVNGNVADMFQSMSKNGGASRSPAAPKKRTVEKTYQKKTQLEHILLRPDTYIGSVEKSTEQMWVYDSVDDKFVQREITYVPGLYKIFDEILVNAADNKQRDPKMDTIKVDIDQEKNEISVYNNGHGIPVVMHKDENMYVPTMIFGHLLTSSNYNDDDKKVTGGRNGYGAKLCNIFSSKFTVETSNKEYKRSFKQTWADNMSKMSEAKIKDFRGGEECTKITFSPDLNKFKMESLDNDTVSLLSRRAYDIAAASMGVKVFLNGKRLPVKSFKDYVELFIKDKVDDNDVPLKVAYEKCSPRWEVAVTISDKGYQQMSFVNSIATTKGGRHVDYITNMLVNNLSETINKKNKGLQIKPFMIKSHLWVFVNCLIENPTFDSQTKETMTLQSKNFGSKCSMSDKYLNSVIKSGIVETVLTWAKLKEQAQLQKKSAGKKTSKIKGIPKLEDANDAGSKSSSDCTLILTEGDSAKTLAVAGLGVVGRDKYGVFPLKGKVLNTREATMKQIMENAEINNIIKILGLQYKKKYLTMDDLKSLRYGKLMIMTDQDQDGSHIKGLLINFIHHNWPSLLKLPFLEEFITPIVKATKGKEEISFYSLPEFEEWKSEKDNWHTYKIKYYKGLGTSTSKEAKEYFSDMVRHKIKFEYNGTQDDNNITMAFSKKACDQRKEWLTSWMEEGKRRKQLGLPEIYLYEKDTTTVNYSDFINKELVLFSNADNERSIPCIVDGFKPGQRKVMFTCIKRNDKKEVKVAQLAGSIAEKTAYHHGEASLMGTIINLAQNYVGSNNINLLQPIGQFGTRLMGGKDSASPRYIFSKLSPLTRLIYHEHDDPLLNYLDEDNLKIEPEWFMPVIPMILVNGSEGIGTGWSTKIPNYNPREIIDNLKRMINNEEPLDMIPWYKNFRGTIEMVESDRYLVNGEVSRLQHGQYEVTELPIKIWTQNYKENVMETLLGTDKTPAIISDYREYNTDTTIRFVVNVPEDKVNHIKNEGPHKVFKLQGSIATSSMVLFDSAGCLRKYNSPMEILKEFYTLRHEYYVKRKNYMVGSLNAEATKLSNQARFILEVCEGKLVVSFKKHKVLIAELISRGYESDPLKAWKKLQDKNTAMEEEHADRDSSDEDASAVDEDSNYEYLLGMPISSLTKEKCDNLLKKEQEKIHELKVLKEKTPDDLWIFDLDTLRTELDRVEAQEIAEEKQSRLKNRAKQAAAAGGRRKKTTEEVLPSASGKLIHPKVNEELRMRLEKASAAGKARKNVKIATVVAEDKSIDEFDEITTNNTGKTLSSKLGNSPDMIAKKAKADAKTKKSDGLTQTKLNFGLNKKKTSKNPWSDDSDGGDNSDVSVEVQPRERAAGSRRTAAVKAKFNFSDSEEEDDSSDSDLSLHSNEGINEGKSGPEIASFLDDTNNDTFMEPAEVVKADSPQKSAPAKTKPASKATVKKKIAVVESDDEVVISDSDSEFGGYQPTAKKSKPTSAPVPKTKSPEQRPSASDLFDSFMSSDGSPPPLADRAENKRRISASSDDDFDAMVVDNDEPAPKKPKPNNAPKPKKQAAPKIATDSDSESDDDFDESKSIKKKSSPKKAKAAPKKKASKKNDDTFCLDDSDDGDSAPKAVAVPRGATTGRSRKPVTYNVGDSDSDY